MRSFYILYLALFIPCFVCAKDEQGISQAAYGKTADGESVEAYTLTNSYGMKVKIITLGGIISEVWTPDKDGKMADVVLGRDNLKGYLDGHPYFGASRDAWPIALPKASLRSMAKSIRWRQTTARMLCMAGKKASTKSCGLQRPRRTDSAILSY